MYCVVLGRSGSASALPPCLQTWTIMVLAKVVWIAHQHLQMPVYVCMIAHQHSQMPVYACRRQTMVRGLGWLTRSQDEMPQRWVSEHIIRCWLQVSVILPFESLLVTLILQGNRRKGAKEWAALLDSSVHTPAIKVVLCRHSIINFFVWGDCWRWFSTRSEK